jgi:5-methylcytosine-specific restriction endonuclease McrA
MSNLFAPTCAMEPITGCRNRVGYHSRKARADGKGYTCNYKTCCEDHRGPMKPAVDNYKMSKGCENVDGRLGYVCTATIVDPCQLEIDHIDGNKHNNTLENRQILCSNCHHVKTKMFKDHLNSYSTQVDVSDNPLFDIA